MDRFVGDAWNRSRGAKGFFADRERIIPDELTGSINETYAAGLDEVSGRPGEPSIGSKGIQGTANWISQTVEYITGK